MNDVHEDVMLCEIESVTVGVKSPIAKFVPVLEQCRQCSEGEPNQKVNLAVKATARRSKEDLRASLR